MSCTPYDALKWAVNELELHKTEFRHIVSRATCSPKTTEHLNHVLLKPLDMFECLYRVAIQCSKVLDNVTHLLFMTPSPRRKNEALHDVELFKENPTTPKSLQGHCEEYEI